MQYLIHHLTEYIYSAPISESLMEVRMMPRSEGRQRCWRFRLQTSPRSRVLSHDDHRGNIIHHFSVPAKHNRLTITAESLVQVEAGPPLPEALDLGDWQRLDQATQTLDFWDDLAPSKFSKPTPALEEFARRVGWAERPACDPLSALRQLTTTIVNEFEYVPNSTKVDSPIDEALSLRAGVCQDFAHIWIALARRAGIPARYVSGYLYHREQDHDRSQADATHAWAEAWLPGLDWVGFDPTNDLIVTDRHIRVAIGRDYADVPPTRGVYRGEAQGTIKVIVKVEPSEAISLADEYDLLNSDNPPLPLHEPPPQQQQQQQQQ